MRHRSERGEEGRTVVEQDRNGGVAEGAAAEANGAANTKTVRQKMVVSFARSAPREPAPGPMWRKNGGRARTGMTGRVWEPLADA